jgi:hypothetical protein
MRCPECNHFVSFDDEGEPDVDIDVEDDGAYSGTIRIVNCCADCGTELTEFTFDVEGDMAIVHRTKCTEPEVSLDGTSADRTQRTEGKGRGTKTFYGVSVECEVTCVCGANQTFTFDDEVQASYMDALV